MCQQPGHGSRTLRMLEVATTELQRHVKRLHGCHAEHQKAVAVREEFQGEVAWEGAVHVYSLTDHPSATRCYAWSSPVEGSENRRFYAVLHTNSIDSPAKAVQAAIVSDFRSET